MARVRPSIVRFALVAVCCLPIRANGQTQVNASALEITGAGVERLSPTLARKDLGKLDPIALPIRQERFTIKNVSVASITIERAQPTCGCTSVIMGAPTGDGSHALAPGESVDLDVSIDISHLHAGPIDKFVQLIVKGKQTPEAAIEIVGSIDEIVGFSKSRLDFGKIKAGVGASATLDARLDPRVAAMRGLALTSDNPDVIVMPDPGLTPTANTMIDVVTISKSARNGFVNANVSFDVKRLHPQTEIERRIVETLRSASVMVVGEVVGSFDLTPRIALFGTIPVGVQAERSLTIDDIDSASLRRLAVRSDNRGVIGMVVFPSGRPSGGDAKPKLVIRIPVGVPAGPIEAHLSLTLPNGERMTVPVYGYISK